MLSELPAGADNQQEMDIYRCVISAFVYYVQARLSFLSAEIIVYMITRVALWLIATHQYVLFSYQSLRSFGILTTTKACKYVILYLSRANSHLVHRTLATANCCHFARSTVRKFVHPT